MPRAAAPMPWATAIQTAAAPRPSIAKKRKTGPGPLRTARGAGRAAFDRPRPLLEGAAFRAVLLRPELRDRVLERPRVDVLLLRDPGGEDVRVAMLTTLRESHEQHRSHSSVSR
ncbi:hypothetical protein GCM10009843_00810 [Nocardioides bigeumensis]|uniref:Uncharacterized protein n=1 Tax=Nocardioides bigeumensis TaxID=433657 RepID=A0ABN2XKS0_9ACTN